MNSTLYIVFIALLGALLGPVFGSGDTTSQSEADTSYIPAKSGYQVQKEGAATTVNKAKKIFMETMHDLGRQILGDSTTIREDPYINQYS